MRNVASVGILLLVLSAAQSGPSVAERLAIHRNLGKAFYENPTTQALAVVEFRKAYELQPNSSRERLNYALALLRAGSTEQGIDELEKTQKQDPSLPHTWFNLGIQFKRRGEADKARIQFRKMAELDPNDPITQYNLGVLEKLDGRMEQAAAAFENSLRLDAMLTAPHFQLFNLYRQMDKSVESQKHLADFQRLKKDQEGAAIPEDMEWNKYAEVLDEVAPPGDPAPVVVARWEDRPIALPGGLNVESLTRFDHGVIALGGNQAWLLQVGQPPKLLPALAGAISVAVGDFDNDGISDLCVITPTEAFLSKKFARGLTVAKGKFTKAVWIDYDHDYDLDLVLLGEEQKLFRNQGPAGFVDKTASFPFVKGVALDAVAFRLEAETKGWDLAVSYADRDGVLYHDQLGGVFKPMDWPASQGRKDLVAGDLDRDGEVDIRSGSKVFYNRLTRGMRSWVPGEWKEAFAAGVVLDGGDIAYLDAKQQPHFAINRAVGSNWLRVQLTGVKNLKLAQGSEVEVKYGRFYQKQVYNGDPIAFDLGSYKKAEVVRIAWPNGLIQNEMNQTTAAGLRAKEAQRLSGSCPMIWIWNGKEFEFVTDILGVAPLGASSGDGGYFPVDHDEYIQIPEGTLKAKDGRFNIRITEELSEVAYLDEVALVTVDHPPGQDIFVPDKFQTPPYSEFRIYGVSHKMPLLGARENGLNDVRAALAKRDAIYPRGFRRDAAGVAEMHSLELDIAPGSDLLLLNGWVDWADGSTFLGASQESKDGLVFPRIEVKGLDGKWKVAVADMGIPAGKPKTIVVELPATISRKGATIRIVTNLALYWDEVFTASNENFEGTISTLHAVDAVTKFRGFSKAIIHPQRLQPERFLYFPSSPVSMWNQTPGLYTRYGDVRELLNNPDDRFVIMGSGDELQLQFNANSLPALAPGFVRSFLLKVDGWAKDRDANTAFSQSVEPLPFHSMTKYPYSNAERFPADEQHATWRKLYNTRPAIRTLRPLTVSR